MDSTLHFEMNHRATTVKDCVVTLFLAMTENKGRKIVVKIIKAVK